MRRHCADAGSALWRTGLMASLLLLAPAVRAERLFVGILEADSYQSVIYGASAFSRVADLPMALELVQTTLAKAMALPSFSGVSAKDTLRIVQTVDPALPLSDGNPANVALLPLTDNGSAVLEAFASAYRKRTPSEPFTLFEDPAATNLPPLVAVALTGGHLFTSTSRDALAWAWKNRAHLVDAPMQSLPGTLRVLVNPQRFADLIGTRGAKATDFVNADKLLRDFETFAFALALDGQALALTVRGKPLAKTGLDALAASLRPPQERLWNGLPGTAFFASASACGAPDLWDEYFGKTRFRLLRPYAGLAPQEAYSGERLIYLAPTKDGQRFCFVQVEPVKQEAQVTEAIRRLHSVKQDDGIILTPQPVRRAGDVDIHSYAISLKPPAAAPGEKTAEASLSFTLLSLFLKQTVLETAVTRGHLIAVIGVANTIENELSALTFPEGPVTLHRKISGQDPALGEALSVGASLHLASLLRHMVSVIPDVKPEQVRIMPSGGDGATFGISQSADHTLTASLRFHSNEIAALQRINRDGRAVLQELFFQMFAKQMMELQQPKKEGSGAPPRKAP